jgi:hypothetical protein
MRRRTLARALLVTSVCALLVTLVPPMAGAWMERMSGTMGAYSPASRTLITETPRQSRGSAAPGAPVSALLLGLSSGLVGFLLGLLLGSRLWQRWYRRHRRQRDIDRLTEDFQALFRKSDAGG